MNRVLPFAPQRSEIDLSFEPDFDLGSARVRPSRHELLIGGRSESLEPRVMQVLVALGRVPGETVTRDELIDRCWDGRCVSDDAINRTISRIRAVAQRDPNSFRIETRPRLGYRLFVAEGEGGDETADASVSPDPQRPAGPASPPPTPPPAEIAGEGARPRFIRNKAALFIGGVAVLLLAALLIGRLPGGPASGPINVRLASFVSLSPGTPASLPSSLRDELATAFGVDDAVTVLSGAGDGEEGSFALGGTVRKVDDRLWFTLQVQNEATGAVLLTENVDRPFSQGPLAARQAAVSLSQVVRCGLTGAAQYPGRLPDSTLALYFQYCQELWSGSTNNDNRALHLARRVTKATPDFSRGWSGLAAAAGYIVRSGDGGAHANLRAEGLEAAAEAIRLDPENSQAWAARGNLAPPRAYAEREALYRRAVAGRPTDCSCEHQDYGHFLASVGRWREALVQFQRGHDMQPLGASANSSVALALATVGQDEDAREILGRATILWPERPNLRHIALQMALSNRRYDDALKIVLDPAYERPAQTRSALVAAVEALKSGAVPQRKQASAQLEGLARSPTFGDPLVVAALASLGEHGRALAAAERLIGNRGPFQMRILFDPSLGPARSTPEFAPIVEKLGLVSFWRESRTGPDFCKEPGAPPLCRALI